MYIRTDRHDAASLDIERDGVEVCRDGDGLATINQLIAPEVIPLCALWQIDRCRLFGCEVGVEIVGLFLVVGVAVIPATHSIDLDHLLGSILCLKDRSSEESRTEHILIANLIDVLVIREIHHQCTHESAVVG